MSARGPSLPTLNVRCDGEFWVVQSEHAAVIAETTRMTLSGSRPPDFATKCNPPPPLCDKDMVVGLGKHETARIHHVYPRRSRTLQQPLNHHLAQLNIGRLRYEVDDPRMADFTNNLALVNGLAESSAGFLWR
jgi:Domain of unknown function (DUF3291)